MNKKFTFLTAALALLAFLAIPIGVWGQSSTSSLVFTAACGGSGTADDGASWTVTSDGTESNFDNTKGIHYGTGSAAVQYIQLSTSDISGNITKIVVNASTASGVTATVGVTVGGSAFGGDPQSLSATATEYTFNGSASGDIVVLITKPSQATKALYCKSIVVTYEAGGGSTTPTLSIDPTSAEPFTYVVGNGPSDEQLFEVTGTNLSSNDITVSVPSDCAFEITDDTEYGNSVTIESGAFFSVRMKAGLDAGGYNATLSITSTGAETIDVALSGSVTEPITYTIAYEWVRTDLDELTEDDVFVIVGNNGNTFAMPNNGGADSPTASPIIIVDDKLSTNPAENLMWNLSGNSNDGYTFYVNGSTTNFLYCLDNNSGLRIGTGSGNYSNTFVLSEGYLKTTVSGTDRYVGIYNSQDWRSYKTITGTSNIAGQTFGFYKREIVYKKYIKGYSTATNPDGGYYLIASPVASVTPSTDNGFIATPASDYDLYSFDPNEEYEWRNYKQGNGFDLVSGKGYLYASKYDTELIFKGEPYNGNGEVTLTKSENNTSEVNKAMNLVGNPYATKATPSKDYYTLNKDGSEIVAEPKNGAIDPMVGIFVKANYDGETMTFTPQDEQSAPQQLSQIVANLRQDRRNATIDRAIVRFGDDSQLPKFMFNEDNTKLYIPQNGVDYAVVSNEGEAEMPINFKAAQNGTYTLCFEVENLEMDQLTLIDNLTGTETNLLSTPSYTFTAKTTDYASRFRLVFGYTGIGENSEIANFAYYNGSEWVINASENATVEVVDMMGRVVRTANGTVSATGMTAGVYMLRLIDGNNVKTQKIVVK